MRDHAALLAQALERENVSCSLRWLWRSGGSFGSTRAQVRDWARELAGELERDPPDAVLLHYSVFAFSYRGLPLLVAPILSALRGSGIPVVSVMHEYAYPWQRGGARGAVWAVSQRALLFEVVRVSAALVVTADFRAAWFASRFWLPKRSTVLAPVFSNLPPPLTGSKPDRHESVIGLFGYSHEVVAVSVVLDAMRLLEDRGVQARLLLLGSPGRASAIADTWLREARMRGLANPPSFSGALPAQALSDALATCDVLLSADRSGPISRRTTLAASLASARPVVALDGPRAWPQLLRSDAAVVVAPTANALAEALASLLGDEGRRETLGARGREFARRTMDAGRSAEVIARLLEQIAGRPGPVSAGM